jgi:hypothetical protein
LHLAADHEPTAEEVDVVDLHRGGLAEAEAREGAERDERGEPFLGDGQERTDLGRRRDGRGLGTAATAGERHASLGSDAMRPSLTAPRRTERRFCTRVWTVPGARPAASTCLTHDSTCERRSERLDVAEGRTPDGEAHRQLGGRPG